MENNTASGQIVCLFLASVLCLVHSLCPTTTCDTQFSALNHSITQLICPANCWKQHSTLCGDGVYSAGPVCLAAMREQLIDASGGLIQVFKTSTQFSVSEAIQNGVTSQTCSISGPFYSLQMTCSTNGETQYPITEVNCPPGCQGQIYPCGTNAYHVTSSVCAAARQDNGSNGGSVTVYRYVNESNIVITNSSNGCTAASWFAFTDVDSCSFGNPCKNQGTCVDLLADYGCICAPAYIGKSCDKACNHYMGLKNWTIPDSALSASSLWANNAGNAAKFGRLDYSGKSGTNPGGWAGGKQQAGEWIQVQLNQTYLVSGVITQGRGDNTVSQWVTTYKIAYISPTSTAWREISNSTGQSIIFVGNHDNLTPKTNLFPHPIEAVTLRLIVQTWRYTIVLRHEYLIC